MSTTAIPFKIDIPDKVLGRIRAHVIAYPWDAMINMPGWEAGINLGYMRELCAYWVSEYDWREYEAALNTFDHFKASIDGMDVHYIHEKGSGDHINILTILPSVFDFESGTAASKINDLPVTTFSLNGATRSPDARCCSMSA